MSSFWVLLPGETLLVEAFQHSALLELDAVRPRRSRRLDHVLGYLNLALVVLPDLGCNHTTIKRHSGTVEFSVHLQKLVKKVKTFRVKKIFFLNWKYHKKPISWFLSKKLGSKKCTVPKLFKGFGQSRLKRDNNQQGYPKQPITEIIQPLLMVGFFGEKCKTLKSFFSSCHYNDHFLSMFWFPRR